METVSPGAADKDEVLMKLCSILDTPASQSLFLSFALLVVFCAVGSCASRQPCAETGIRHTGTVST